MAGFQFSGKLANLLAVSTEQFNFTNQERNYVKEMQSVRNRWAHLDAYGVDVDDMYRDVDTDVHARPVVFGTLAVEK